jgi:hypothetical protein
MFFSASRVVDSALPRESKMTARTQKILLISAIAAMAASAVASETITYSYDARGRLVKVQRSGSVNNNVTANYSYDKADNRTNVNVTSPNPPPQ